MTDSSVCPITERIVALTRDLVLIPSTELRPVERRQCYAFVKNHLEYLPHVEIREYERDGYPSLVATPPGRLEPEVLICAHLDVIAHPELPAYRSTIRDGRIWGPGCGDMKGALAICLELFRTICSEHPDASIGLAITSDEETGGEHGIGYLVEEEGLSCGTAMVPDGGSLNEITVEEKGLLHLRLHGDGHAAHAAQPWLGHNAIEHMMSRLDALRAHFDALRCEDDTWHPTCAVTVFSTANRSTNRVPAHAEAMLDIRFPPPFTADDLLRDVRRVLDGEIEVERVISAEPVHLDPDPLYAEITEQVTGRPAALVRGHGASDARFFSARGIPALMSRPLVGNLHAEDEWIDIASMETFYKIYMQYISRKLGLRYTDQGQYQ